MGRYRRLDIFCEIRIHDARRINRSQGQTFRECSSGRPRRANHGYRLGIVLDDHLSAGPNARQNSFKVAGGLSLGNMDGILHRAIITLASSLPLPALVLSPTLQQEAAPRLSHMSAPA